jgi:starch synthase
MSDRNKRLKILMAAAECAPYAKVGGLADVVGSLPSALSRQGIDVRVIMPLYGVIDKEKYDLKKIYSGLEVPSGRILMKVNIYEGIIPSSNVKIFFLDSPEYFSQKHIYGKGDNSERFLFFFFGRALRDTGFEF